MFEKIYISGGGAIFPQTTKKMRADIFLVKILNFNMTQ